VPISTSSDRASLLRRVCFWFVSLLLAVLAFSLFAGRAEEPSVSISIFRDTMIFAFPVWCLYLPLIFFLRNADWRQTAILLLTGILIGPAALFIWCLIQLPMGQNLFQRFWNGDSEAGMGAGIAMIFATIVGLLTSVIYVLFLKFVRPRHTAPKSV
jgi:hypothetical protein